MTEGGTALPTVAAAVCAFRRPEGLAAVLASLDQQTLPPDVVYVIDNDVAESAEGCRRPSGARLEYFSMGRNAGPAGAFAMAVQLAQRDLEGPDWMVLVGDDNPLPFDDLLETLAKLIVHPETKDGVAGVGLGGARFDRNKGTVRLADAELHGPVQVDYVAGGGRPCYNIRVLERLGLGFDSTLFFGFEELDLGMQIRSAGAEVVIDGDWLLAARTRAGKLGNSSRPADERRRSPWRTYYSIRNYILVSLRHSRPLGRARTIALASAMVLSRAIDPRRWNDLRPAALGWFHGVRGVSGRVYEP